MSVSTRAPNALHAACGTHAGLKRDVNEDRVHADAQRGVFIVVDGIGGQAAGGKAADVAIDRLRLELEDYSVPADRRIRQAITAANNDIYRVAESRAEWNGMACVLTVVAIEDGRAVVGHVGDTRLYKLRHGRIAKITRDHSPVGEREDAHEISEIEAMRHPRRNQVYRDVGSEPHRADDPEFIDTFDVAFEPDAALLLCSDGLSDLVEAAAIRRIAREHAGEPPLVVQRLIQAANDAGGTDNVSVVYVEGDRFAISALELGSDSDDRTDDLPRRSEDPGSTASSGRSHSTRNRLLLIALAGLLALGTAAVLRGWPERWRIPLGAPAEQPHDARIVVNPDSSIAEAISAAPVGSEVLVEPGEYHESVVLKSGVRVVSRVSRGATIRLAGSASESDPAVVADGVVEAALVGFRIVGDAASPLGIGVLMKDSTMSLVDVEIAGAAVAAVDVSGSVSSASVLASEIHDNPGAAVAIRSEAAIRLAHNVFAANGGSERVQGAFIIDTDSRPQFVNNVFRGVGHEAFGRLNEEARSALMRDNWFIPASDLRNRPPADARSKQGR